MPGKESRNSQHNLFHVFIFCLILLAVVLLLIHKRAEEGRQLHPEKNEAVTETVDARAIVANDVPPQDIVEPTKVCQTSAGAVAVPARDECPEDQAAAESMPEPEPSATETPPEPGPEPGLPVATANLKRYFTFSSDLDLRVDSFGCQPVLDVVSGGKSLEEVRANYLIYRDESLSLDELLAVDRSIFYDYIISFDAYLNDSGAKRPADDVMAYLDLYRECRLDLTAKNTGLPRILADGCGLGFFRDVSLLDAAGGSIGPHGFRSVLCTKATVSFPTGATDSDTQYFVLPADAEPAVIMIDNRERQGVEAVIAVPGS